MSSPKLNRREMLAASVAIGAPLVLPPRRGNLGPCTLHPAPACEPPKTYTFKLGDFDVTTVSDADAVIDGPHPIVGEDQKPELVAALMRENLLPEKRFQPGFTPTLVRAGKELILFDTGNGANGFVPRPYGGQLSKQLGLAGIAPESVTMVVLTHTHPDHVAGLMEDGKPLFPKARYVMGQVEHDFWAKSTWRSAKPDSNDYKTGLFFESHIRPYRGRLTLIKGEGEVATGIQAIPAYGHTPGHLAFHIESANQRLLLWGDCAHHEVASLAHPEWHAFFDMDKAAGAATRRRIYEMAAKERIPVVGYHSSFPSVGFVQGIGAGYRWVPVTYQLRV
jgi:glyoxylase-like metal-dependent hydrolase (beta-lactamase superfamily II)